MEAKRKEELLDSTVQLFENIAQELTMPVTMISGPCQQILEYEKSDSFIRQHSEKILQQSGKLQSMLKMFQNFRDSNDSGQSRAQMFNVSELAEEISKTFTRHAEDRKITFIKTIQPNLVWNTAYKEVATVMEMLLTDAFINAEKNGMVSLEINTAENLLKIAISNSGANGNMERLSETFEKISAIEYPNNVNTSGLSFNNEMRLVVCKSIVTKLGGHIAADSKDGKTMLTISLPPMNISEEKTIEKYSSYEELQEGARIENAEMYKEQLMDFDTVLERPTMYITGKDPEIMNFIAELFSSQYNIKMFNDCNEALYAIHNTQPDIMIFEYMTRLDEVTNAIKAAKPSTIINSVWEVRKFSALAVAPTVISNITLLLAVRNIGGTLTSILGALEPVTAVCIGVLVFGEAFTFNEAVGMVLILAAVSLVILGKGIRDNLNILLKRIRPRHP